MKRIKEYFFDICYYDKLSDKYLNDIIMEYEKSYKFFEDFFNRKINLKLKLFVYEKPEDVGTAYGDNEPCNGFAREPNELHFVYNEKIKCTGNHELAHILSYLYIGKPESAFIREGFAEFTEDYWTNIINGEIVRKSHYEWAKLYFESSKEFNIKDILFNSERFYQEVDKDGCFYTYPLAGAFTKFLVEKYGKETYLDFYRDGSEEKFTLLYSNCDILLTEFENYIVK